MTLHDEALIIRSKNAGPFSVTIDIMTDTDEKFARLLNAPAFTAERIGALYHVPAVEVKIHPAKRMRTVKVTMPRNICSGAPGDSDVYGSQQHFPLAAIEI